MCFSPQADIVGGVVVTAIGVDAYRHLRGRNDHLLLATLPLLLGVHQIDEVFVWWGLEGHVPHLAGRVALWIYLLIAFVVLPMFVPIAVLALEPTPQRRWRMAPFVVLGAGVSSVLFASMLRAPIGVTEHSYHLAYSVQLSHGGLLVGLYVTAVCGALLFSGYRHVEIFGFANFVAVAVLAWLTLDGFASLWCGYAALSSGAIALHLRYARPHREHPYVLT
jgi:hypothetical protein